MSEVARAAGVSVSSISNAYNRPEKLSPAVRNRILDVATSLGYVGPDPVARSLRRRRTGGVGVVFTDDLEFAFSDPASSGFLAGVGRELMARSNHLVLLPTGTPDRDRLAELDRAAVDGVILHSLPSRNATLDLLERRGAPAVVVDQPGPVPGLGWVGLDEVAGMRAVGEHLRDLGHRHVGVITSRLSTRPYDGRVGGARRRRSVYDIPRWRIHGLEEGLGRTVTVEERWRVSEDDGARAAAALWSQHPRVTAIACIADTYALGVLRWARERSIEVPHHLTVTGYDDVARAAEVGLTTVAQPFSEKGRAAAGLLLEMVDGVDPRHVVLPTRLHERASSGPPLVR